MSMEHIQQYQQMVYMIWLGCRFEGDALVRFERLAAVYNDRFPWSPRLRREVYAA